MKKKNDKQNKKKSYIILNMDRMQQFTNFISSNIIN